MQVLLSAFRLHHLRARTRKLAFCFGRGGGGEGEIVINPEVASELGVEGLNR